MGDKRAREAKHKEQMVRGSDINEGVERQGKVSERSGKEDDEQGSSKASRA